MNSFHVLEELHPLTIVQDVRGTARLVTSDRAVFRAVLRDLNGPSTLETFFALDVEEKSSGLDDAGAAGMLRGLFHNYGIEMEGGDASSMESFSEVVSQGGVRFSSMIHLYRKSYNEVELSLAFIRMIIDDE